MDVTCTGGAASRGAVENSKGFSTNIGILILILLSCSASETSTFGAGLGRRTENTTLRLPLRANGVSYATENAFGDLTFTHPMTVVAPPGERSRIFVVEQGGTIVLI